MVDDECAITIKRYCGYNKACAHQRRAGQSVRDGSMTGGLGMRCQLFRSLAVFPPFAHRPACDQVTTSKICGNELAAASRTPWSISECTW